MRFTATSLALAASVVGLAKAAATVPTIESVEIKDRHFIYSNSKKPFFIKGVDYQPGGAANFEAGSDPLSDVNQCARDIYLFQKLGINTIRVYSVDPELDHDECMTLLAQAGIYLVLDVNSPLEHQHLHKDLPWTTYTPMYLEHIFTTIDVFSGYPNTLMFLAGNEVVFDKKSAAAAPQYIKAVIRDMKAYITNHVNRIIPVGYSNADDLDFRTSLAHYLECGDEGYADFFGVNSYQWCGDNDFSGSGYDKLVEDYTPFSFPVYFTEFGCNVSPPRLWQEIGSIYHTNMTSVFSGGLVYEFTEEPNNYGLVQLDKKGNVETLKDYERLQAAYAKVEGTQIPQGAKLFERPRTCADEDDEIFKHITANHTLPATLGADFIEKGLKGVTRGKLLAKVDTTATKLKVTVADKAVAKPEITPVYSTNVKPMASGGHGINTGGGVGKGEPSGSKDVVQGSSSSSGTSSGTSAASEAGSSENSAAGHVVPSIALAAVAMVAALL